MADTRILDVSPGGTCKMVWDDADGTFTIVNEQACDAIMEHNKADYASTDERARWRDDQLVARVPMIIMQDLIAKGIDQDDKAMKRFLNDPDNRVFRTRPGRV